MKTAIIVIIMNIVNVSFLLLMKYFLEYHRADLIVQSTFH